MPIPQQYHQNLVHYLRKEVNYNDPGINTGSLIGRLPANAQLMQVIVRLKTPFNAGAANSLTIGTNPATYDNVVGSVDINEAAAGTYGAQGSNLIDVSAETDLYVRYAQSGTPANAGRAIVHVAYTVNNG